MAVCNEAVTEEFVSIERHLDALRQLDKMTRAAKILESAVLAVIDCKDTVVREGTQRTILRVIDLCEMAWLESEVALAETPEQAAQADQPFCTNCQTHLSESSLQAGYCLKCTHEAMRQ